MSIIYFILILSVVILVHEFGHLITAKMFGVHCYEYSIGFGPKLISKKGKETEYSVRAIPLGGYVRMAGEEKLDDDIEVPFERQINGIAPVKRMIVFLAGIFNNIILGIIIYAIVYLMAGSYVRYPAPVITSVNEGYPAYEAGLMADDRIYSMTFENGICIKPRTSNDISAYINSIAGDVEITVLRNSEKFTYTVTPVKSEDRYVIGVIMGEVKIEEVKPLNCLYYGFLGAKETALQVIDTLANLIVGRGLDSLSGPIGVYEITDSLVDESENAYEMVFYLLQIMGLLTVNIGLFNLVPITMLDGGRVVLCLIEMVRGKPTDKKVENILMYASLVLIGAIFLLAVFNDFSKFVF